MKQDTDASSHYAILVIDDTPDNLRFLAKLLKEKGYRVRLARDGQTGLMSATASVPDLILLDIMMPDLDGYEVCRRLKSQPQTQAIPVIFISALDAVLDKVKAFAVGGVDYISKPFQVEEVLARIETHLTLRNLGRQLEAQNTRLQEQVVVHQEIEQLVRDREAMLRAMSDAAHDAFMMIDGQDRVIFWNRAAEKMFGYSKAEAMGRSLHALITLPDDQRKALAGLQHFVQTGQGSVLDSVMEFTAVRKNGEQFPVERAVAAFQMGEEWYAVGSLRDITERKQADAQLHRMAETDGLTGIYNRRHFLHLAELELERVTRHQHNLAFLMIDVDRFKSINDTYGHSVGDKVLQRLTQVMRESLRKIDIFGRLGGEEFAVLMPQTDEQQARHAAERLREAVQQSRVVIAQGEVTFTVSIGIQALSTEADTLDLLMKRADEALYQAKEGGRNQVVIMRKSMR